jgi:hypothetical protein
MDYQAFLAERRKLMARVTRDAYVKLSDHGYTPVYPQTGHLRDDDQQGGRAHCGVNLADLIEAELLPGRHHASVRATRSGRHRDSAPGRQDRLRRRDLQHPLRRSRRRGWRIN